MEHQKEGKSLVRELGLTQALAIGLGTMLGAGIFVLSAFAVEDAGPAAVFSYLIAGTICFLIALVISELATGMPKAGGSYTFITEALGPLPGSIVGPGNWLGLSFATGFYLLAFGEYLALIFPIPAQLASAGAGLLFGYLNYRGAKLTGSIQNIIVLILVTILLVFVGVGFFNIDTERYQTMAPNGWGAMIGAIGLIIVSYTGFEKISTISGELKNPERNLPLSITGSVVLATIFYALIVFVLAGTFSHQGISQREAPLVEAAQVFAGRPGYFAMLSAALLATLSSANAAIMASSRISFGMGRDLVLPGWFGQVHPKFNTPGNAVLATSALGIMLSVSGKAEVLAEISSTLFMVSYALLSFSVIIMRSSRPSWYQPTFKTPLFPLIPLIAGTLSIGVIFTMSPESRSAGLALAAGGLVWFFVWVKNNAKVGGEFGPLWERERPLEEIIEKAQEAAAPEKNEIVIPLLPRSDMQALMYITEDLVFYNDRRSVIALDIQETPPQISPQDIESSKQTEKKKVQQNPRMKRIAELGAELGIPVRPMMRAAHGWASGIVSIVESRPNTELILMNWNKPTSAANIYGSPEKTILENVRADVAILRPRRLQETVRRVLIPAGGGPHARLGLRLAAEITHSDQAELTVLRIVSPSPEIELEAEKRALDHLVEEVLAEDIKAKMRTKVVVEKDVVSAIIQEAREDEYDLLVIGASDEWAVKSLLVGSIPDAVADQAPCSVLLVRRHEASSLNAIRRILSSIRGWK
ncbi:MAG: amino acid permease [Anaerolineales bacterium]|nr:amino acid permease [Anaerolineales bacterium]